MSKKFTDDPSITDRLEELLHLHRHYVMENMEEADPAVDGQKTRFYKFKCFIIWGHLPNKNGVCKRCGKQIRISK